MKLSRAELPSKYRIAIGLKYAVAFALVVSAIVLYFNNIWFGVLANYEVVVKDDRLVGMVGTSTHTTPLNLYYINLDRSVDRKQRFLERLAPAWVPIRVVADSPDTMPEMVSPAICFTIVDTEYACLASHLKARHMAYRNGEPFAIIAEDDAVITKDIDWELLMSTAPQGWDVLQLHTCCIPEHFNRTSLALHNSNDALWVKTDSIIPSAAFYIMSRAGMLKALTRFIGDFDKPWEQIDRIDLTSSQVNCHADMALFNGMERYICMQSYVTTEQGKSTIHWSHDAFMFGVQ